MSEEVKNLPAILSETLRKIVQSRVKKLLPLLFCVLSLYARGEYNGFLPNDKRPIDVGIALFIHNIAYVSEVTSSAHMTANLYQRWKDPSLGFSSTDGQSRFYSGDAADDFLKTIWQPYLEIDEMMTTFSKEGQVVEVEPDGTVNVKTRIQFTLDLNSNLRKFPFDQQNPEICIRSLSYDTNAVRLVRLDNLEGMGNEIQIPNWNLEKEFIATVSPHPMGNTGKSADRYCFQFHLTRISHTYVYQLIVPLVLIVFVSFLTMFVPVENSSKLNVMITAVLTVIAFQWLILNIIPTASYLSFAEAVILLGFLFCCSVAITTCISLVIGIKHSKRAQKIYLRTRIVLPIIYILSNIALAFAFFKD